MKVRLSIGGYPVVFDSVGGDEGVIWFGGVFTELSEGVSGVPMVIAGDEYHVFRYGGGVPVGELAPFNSGEVNTGVVDV